MKSAKPIFAKGFQLDITSPQRLQQRLSIDIASGPSNNRLVKRSLTIIMDHSIALL